MADTRFYGKDETEWRDILKTFYEMRDKTESQQRELMKILLDDIDMPLGLLIIGGTGVGKSSTINALYGENKAKVGLHANPETQEIKEFKISKNITLYDSPGLGEGSEKDKQHMSKINALLQEKDSDGYAKISLALVVIDASVKGLSQEYATITYLLKMLGDTKRILIGLNKCDCALSERFFDRENNMPGKEQEQFLQEKVADLQMRIQRDTGLRLNTDDIVWYSAGFYDGSKQDKPYNIAALEKLILDKLPKHKRVVQTTEESEEASGGGKGFLDYVIDLVDVVTDHIPVLSTIKKVGKGIWDALGKFFS
ncbi:GTPase family protein [Helicobacter sp.]|uniref:GTPase family protein n=1 Tax=Helicobacter sp. TaxID=218 RepID=UPI0025C1CE71|nr:GTPase [Helicobacter sp.]MCI5968123.1 50S ribosome-binding GTPase [Helicobacter sp.]MDY2585418.1 GTPase [Helicobacter sp.]